MAHRGLRKPASRRSLRPRNHSVPPRSAQDGAPASKKRASQAPPSEPLETEFEDELRFEEPDERQIRSSGRAPAGTYASLEAAHEQHPIDHDDPLADAFFRHPDKPVIDVWEETHAPRAMSRGSRRAMYASLGIFAVSLIAIGSYTAYHTLIMPAPVELGASAGETTAALLPTPLAAAPAAPELEAKPVAAVTPEEAPQPAAAAVQREAAPTLAALAAREPPPEQKGQGAQLDGVVGAHLLAIAAAERDGLERPQAKLGAAAAPPQAEAEAEAEEAAPAHSARAPGAAPTYDELVDIGRALLKKNRRVEASEAFRRALLHSPQGSGALSGLAYVYLNTDQNAEARDYARRAVAADATNSEGWIVLGAALELLGDKPASQLAYKSCVAEGRGPYAAQCRQVVR